MAQPQLLQVKLSRFDAQPWGFRLQGGTDFAQPLLVQKVNAGSLSEQAGLQPGDAVIKINDVDVFNLRHKDAQDIVVRSGNNFVITVQRGGSTWRPHVTPTGNVPQPNSPYLQTVTKTSLAHQQQDSQHIGCGYNNAARPFVSTNGGDGGVKSIVNKQYNTPVGIYSDESIAETLSAQAEVLAGGVLGVNFKKNEKEYQGDRSEVLKFLREEETGQSTPAFGKYEHDAPQQQYQAPQQQQQQQYNQQQHYHQQHQHQQQSSATRHVSAPVNTPKPPSTGGLPTGQNICTECERLITPANFYWTQSHAIGGNERRTPLHHQPDERIGVPLQSNTLAPAAPHRPSLPVAAKDKEEQPRQDQEQPDPRIIVLPICPGLQGPEYKAEMEAAAAALASDQDGRPRPLSASGHPACQLCGVGIVGVFVRIKDKNLHVECFKCATCGTSLKNQGYYNFNNKLYCDIHAKQAAINNPPAGTEGYVPVPIKPNTKLSANTISSALNSHGYGSNGYSNGNSTPAPAPPEPESSQELPLPPPPSPTQLLQYEAEELLQQPPAPEQQVPSAQLQLQQQQQQQQPEQHTRTHSSLSSISSGSSSSGVGGSGSGSGVGQSQQSYCSTLSLDRFGSPQHSRQTSASSTSLEVVAAPLAPATAAAAAPGQGDNYTMPPSPPPPPPPASSVTNYRLQATQQQLQNENDMNTQNKGHNAYNQLLKEYSNKLQHQQQQQPPNKNHIQQHTTNTPPTLRHNNNTAKPFAASQQHQQQPLVAALTATLANQLKFNPHQVASPQATVTVTAAATPAPVAAPLTATDSSAAATVTPAAAAATTLATTDTMSANVADEPSSIYGQINTNPAPAAPGGGDQPFEYVTLTGNVIRSVQPPGKGAAPGYKVNQGYARPFGTAAPKSPVSYPPQQQQQSPRPAPGGQNPYATLPRSNAGQQGRNVRYQQQQQHQYSTQQQKQQYRNSYPMGSNYSSPSQSPYITSYNTNNNNFNNNNNNYSTYNNNSVYRGKELAELQPEYEEEDCYEVDIEVAMAASRQSHRNSSFVWPPPQDDSHQAPTAAPLYIPPPETQHVVVTNPVQQVPPLPPGGANGRQLDPQPQAAAAGAPASGGGAPQWQSYSAPQLARQLAEQESSSESYTSTSTTTTTTSEEYQRMYAAQIQAYQMQEQSGSEFDYQVDYNSTQDSMQEYASGRRSAQECVDSLAVPLSTYKLIDMVREVTPSPVTTPVQTPAPSAAPTSRRVVFNDEPEIKELPGELETIPEAIESVEDREGLVIEHRAQILESERMFQPTPEIKFEIAPVRQIPPTRIPNPSPKEWINPMIRVLTTAPEVPFHLVECPFPRPCGDDFEAEAEAAEAARVQEVPAAVPAQQQPPPPPEPAPVEPPPAPLRESPPRGSRLTQAMITAPEFELKFAPPADQGIPLPEETVPYMPPPMDMKPYLREDYRPKSPFVSALTTAPDRPFEGHFDRDVPIHLIDLPTPKEHLTMGDALCTAPERGYTPLNPENAMHRVDEEQKQQELKKREFQVLDHEEELGIRPEPPQSVEYYVTQKDQPRKSSAFAAMQAFQPSREPLSSNSNSNTVSNAASVTATPRASIISSLAEADTDLEYQKYCKAQQRNQKRLEYFHMKEEELGGVFGATSAPKRGRGILNKAAGPGVRIPLCNSCNVQIRPQPQATDLEHSQEPDATSMLAESVGRINMGDKTNAFMHEAGKIINNMLEARLANNGGPSAPLSHAGSAQSLRSNSSSNLSKSPMIVRKRLDLDDFKNLDPTQPVTLQPVVALHPQKDLPTELGHQKAQAQVPRVEQTLQMELPAQQHPMGKILDLCDGGKAIDAPEPVAFRNNLRRTGASHHAADRRSYIEPKQPAAPTASNQSASQNGKENSSPTYCVSVKALGPNSEDQTTMSEENERAVSQLLKEGKKPVCCQCNKEITSGPFITALGKIWCPDHFICVNGNCRRPLQDIGFVEEKGDLYCEYCFEKYLAPTCSKCAGKIKGDCLNAIGKHFHPECFTCGQCGKIFGNTPFFLEDGNAYCEADWNELFTTKCFACGFPVEAGDRWVEALNHNYHSQCFNCTFCKQNLEGQSFYNKGGRPFCKNHAR
ncbi:hypothetical protein KR054_008844 [Drosophila jambulina]|nr:hypothetical protein KR054_008844 [Drosophila jambulina]